MFVRHSVSFKAEMTKSCSLND